MRSRGQISEKDAILESDSVFAGKRERGEEKGRGNSGVVLIRGPPLAGY